MTNRKQDVDASGPAREQTQESASTAREAEADDFWRGLDSLVAAAQVVIDRPAGSAHPHNASHIYPLDYGYLDGTMSGDGEGIDVWIGSMAERSVTGLVCTVDLYKRDLEAKILLGCSGADCRKIQRFFALMHLPHRIVPRDLVPPERNLNETGERERK